jgi:hypothetical protein
MGATFGLHAGIIRQNVIAAPEKMAGTFVKIRKRGTR